MIGIIELMNYRFTRFGEQLLVIVGYLMLRKVNSQAVNEFDSGLAAHRLYSSVSVLLSSCLKILVYYVVFFVIWLDQAGNKIGYYLFL